MLPQRSRGDTDLQILNAITLKQVPAEGPSNTFEYCSYILSECMQNDLFIMMMQGTTRRITADGIIFRRVKNERKKLFVSSIVAVRPSSRRKVLLETMAALIPGERRRR